VKRRRRDIGRIGSINAQALFLDRRHRVWTTDDYGHLVRYDPAKDRIERSPTVLPHDPVRQTGWHSVFYDVVAAPGGDHLYAVAWNGLPRLMRIWPDEGEWGRVEDLGLVTSSHDPALPEDYFVSHCGGLTFGGDGALYYVASRWQGAFPSNQEATARCSILEEQRPVHGIVWRMEEASGVRTEVAVLERPDACAQYVSRGAADRHGNLFFGHVGPRPVGLFKVTPPPDRRRGDAHLPLRMWG